MGLPANAADKPSEAELMTYELISACNFGTIAKVTELLDKGADPDAVSRSDPGSFPLRSAVWRGSPEVVALLLKRGANVSRTTGFVQGYTILHLAAEHWKPESGDAIIKLLMDAGCKVNARDASGMTALAVATRHGPDGMKVLLNAGATGDSIALGEAAANLQAEAFDLLLSHGATIDRENKETGGTLMHKAVSQVHGEQNVTEENIVRQLERLRALGVPVDHLDEYGNAPLHGACRAGNKVCVRWLLEHGADPNRATADGRTPLSVAAESQWNSAEVTRLLLKDGARPNASASGQSSPLELAIKTRNWSGAGALLSVKPEDVRSQSAALQLATTAAHVSMPHAKLPDLLKPMLEPGKADIKDAEGTSLLIWCIRAGDHEAVRLVLAAGASCDLPDAAGRTPLHWAVLSGSTEIQEMLRSKGAKPDVRDAAGYTPQALSNLVRPSL